MRLSLACALLTLGVAIANTQEARGGEPEPAARLLVPAYFYPAGKGLEEWNRLIEASERAPIVAIVNPASGPGRRPDPNYQALLAKAGKSKVVLVGYVTLSYAKRPVAEIKAEVDTWARSYPEVRGIFFDEQPSGAKDAPPVLESFAHARDKFKEALVLSNPGTRCASEFLGENGATAACMFEGPTGFDRFALPDWAAKLGPDRFAALLYRTKSAAEMETQLAEIFRKGVGYAYITDAEGANTWNRLPAYWEAEVSAFEKAARKE